MGRHARGDLLALHGEIGLGLDRAIVTGLVEAPSACEGLIEGIDKGTAHRPAIGGLIFQHVGHIAPPILVIATIAFHANGMRRAQRRRQIGGIAEVIGAANRNSRLRRACATEQQRAKQESMKTCLLHATTFARIRERLKGLQHEIEFIVMDEDGLFSHAGDGTVVHDIKPDIVFGNTDVWFGKHTRDFMITVLKTGGIDWFQSSAAGLDNAALISVGRISRIYTTNHTQSEAMAEWAMWQAFDFLKYGPQHRAQQADGRWERVEMREMMDSRWLIVGFGSIGSAVGKRVQLLGGHVTGARRSPGPAEGADHIVPMALVKSELAQADIVLLSLPLTDETAGMVDAEFLGAMRPDALLMNLGRGPLVDEVALLAALDAGRPAFAALDVTAEEPLPKDSPLWRHANVAVTPHDSAATAATYIRADETFLDNLQRYLANEPLRHVVPRETFAD